MWSWLCTNTEINISYRLTLCFVDRKCKSKSDRKLMTLEFEDHVCSRWCWSQGNLWNQSSLSVMFSSDKMDFKNSITHSPNIHASTMAETLGWEGVAKENNWPSDLEIEFTRRKTGRIDWPQQFDWDVLIVFGISSSLTYHLIGTNILNISRHLIQDLFIEVTNIGISWCQDHPVQKIFRGWGWVHMNIRIYGLNKWFHIAESHVLRQVNLGIFNHILAMAYLKKPLVKFLGVSWSSIKTHVLAEKEDFDMFPKVWLLNGCIHNVFMWTFRYNRKGLEKVATKYNSNACERSIIVTDIMQVSINSINCVVVLRL